MPPLPLRHRRLASAVIVAAGAFASVATTMVEWVRTDDVIIPPVHLDSAQPVIEYHLRAKAEGPVTDSRAVLTVTLDHAVTNGAVRATLSGPDGLDRQEVVVNPIAAEPIYFEITPWSQCPTTSCQLDVTLRLELTSPPDVVATADLEGRAELNVSAPGEEPAGVQVDLDVVDEVIP